MSGRARVTAFAIGANLSDTLIGDHSVHKAKRLRHVSNPQTDHTLFGSRLHSSERARFRNVSRGRRLETGTFEMV